MTVEQEPVVLTAKEYNTLVYAVTHDDLDLGIAVETILTARRAEWQAEAWERALAHVLALNDPANTVVETESLVPIVTLGDIERASRRNPYRTGASFVSEADKQQDVTPPRVEGTERA